MKDRRYSYGFTVIEVMLFLGISGLMIAGLMVGIGGSVNRERYNDAVTSFHDYMQGQYNLIDNVNTNREADYSCDNGGISVRPVGSGDPRGTSSCSIVGRLINSQDGKKITSQPIYATADITSLKPNLSEQELLDAMKLQLAPEELSEDRQQYSLAWNTSIYTANSSSQAFSLALIRLHTNNLIRSFASSSYQTSVSEVISNPNREPVVLCLASNGLTSSPTLGVKLSLTAANANGAQRTVGSDGSCS